MTDCSGANAIDGSTQTLPDNTQSPSTISPIVIGLSAACGVLFLLLVVAIIMFMIQTQKRKVETV